MKQRRLLKSVAAVGWGTFVSQAITASAILVLARIYTDEVFGLFALFFTASQLLGASLAMRYEQAIVVAPTEDEAWQLLRLSMAVATGLSILLVPFLLIAGPFLDRLAGSNYGLFWLLIIPTGLFNSYSTTFSMWFIRIGKLNGVSLSRFSKAIATILAQVVIGLTISVGVGALIAGEMLGAIASTLPFLLGMAHILRTERRHILSNDGYLALSEMARRYLDLMRLNLPQVLVNNATYWLIMAILLNQSGASQAGSYWMMQRVLGLPAAFIGAAVAQVYFRDAAQAQRDHGDFADIFKRVFLLILGVGGVAAIIIILFGPQLFAILLGQQWRLAGELAQLYAPFMVVHLLVSTLTPTTQVSRKLGVALVMGVVQSALMLLGIWLGIGFGPTARHAVIGLTLFACPFMLLMLFMFWRMASGRALMPGGKGPIDDA